MTGKLFGNPKIKYTITDVRDVALAHLRALEVPEAAGERILIASG